MGNSVQLQLSFEPKVSPKIPARKPCAGDCSDVTGCVCPESRSVGFPANKLPKTFREQPTWECPRAHNRQFQIWAQCARCTWWYAARRADLNRGKRIYCSHRCATDHAAETKRFSGERNPRWLGGVSNDNMRYRRRQAERWPEHEAARRAVYNAVKSGKLKRLPCSVCGSERSNGHHTDYSKQLDVVWLCRPCHDAEHARLKAGR